MILMLMLSCDSVLLFVFIFVSCVELDYWNMRLGRKKVVIQGNPSAGEGAFCGPKVIFGYLVGTQTFPPTYRI